MALRGIWQLQKLQIYYCNTSGGARGSREFIETLLPRFKAANPQLEIEVNLRRRAEPYLHAFYRNKREKTVGTRNLTAEEILDHAKRFRDAIGHKPKKMKTREISRRRSIQGRWTPFLQI